MSPTEIPNFAVFRDVDASWCPEMVVIPMGSFLMGSPEDEEGRNSNEGPQHWVTIEYRFAIGRYPVTFAEYDHFCEVTKREKLEDQIGRKRWGRGRKPVIRVNWRDVVAYCKWLSMLTRYHYRLPSEAEWEYACRAGTTSRYSWGNTITEKNANYGASVLTSKADEQYFVEVGAYPANRWGLYDMHGSVWEWVEDCWHKNYSGAPEDGTAWIDGEGPDRPLGKWKDGIVTRGGGWRSRPQDCRSASRAGGYGIRTDYCNDDLGFRVARSLSVERPAERGSWWRRLFG